MKKQMGQKILAYTKQARGESMKKAGLMVLALLSLNLSSLFAQWEPDVRLTFDTAVSKTSYNNAWCITAAHDTVHVTWYDDRDGNFEIYYKRSTDAGSTWETNTRLTENPASSARPCVAVFDSNVHILWHDNRDGAFEIYYKRSTDAGSTWATDLRLTDIPHNSLFPCIAVSDSYVHVVWYDHRNGNDEIYYKRSTDAGATWQIDTRLTDDPANSWLPSTAVTDTTIHVVWADDRDGNFEIYYMHSTDNGVTWDTDTRLTNDPANSVSPCIAVLGLNVHVVWYDSRDGNSEIYYKRSTDAGLTWETDIRLTDAPSWSMLASVAVSDAHIHVAWDDNRNGNREIYHKSSTDAGVTWGTDIRLTDASDNSMFSSIVVSDSSIHVVWQDERDGNSEIYYKRNPTGNTGVMGDIYTGGMKSKGFLKISPNPFSKQINISFSRGHPDRITHPSYGTGSAEGLELKIHDVSGRVVKEFTLPIAYSLVPTVISWDGKDNNGQKLPNGIYYCRFSTKIFSQIEKMIFVE